MFTFKKFALATFGVLSPFMALAQQATVETVLATILRYLDSVLLIVMALAVIYFFYGLAKYILAAGSDDSKTEGRNIMIYGVIALFVMASVWGLVGLLQSSFGINAGNAPAIVLPSVVTPRQ